MFKTLQWLVQSLDNEKIFVGAIIAEDESRVSRHLKHCASEREIPMMVSSCFTLYNCIELLMGNHIIPSENFQCLRSAYRYISWLLAHEDSSICFSLHCSTFKPSFGHMLLQPASWIIKSLHSGKLFPFKEKSHSSLLPTNNIPEAPISMDWSEEI